MTTFSLKIIALIFMLIDHIGLFIPYAPQWCRYIGRLSAPLFIFTVVQGFKYTHSQKTYIIRLYLCGLCMGCMDYILSYIRGEDAIINNIFVTLFSIVILIKLIEYKKENSNKWKFFFTLFLLWQIIGIVTCYYIDINYKYLIVLYTGFIGNIFYNEGKFIFVLLGLVFYFAKDNKKRISLYYCIFCTIYIIIFNFNIPQRIMTRLDFYNYDYLYELFILLFPLIGLPVIASTSTSIQWLMIFSLPFILLYNGKKGKNIKYFFYIFYPTHIMILFTISCFLNG